MKIVSKQNLHSQVVAVLVTRAGKQWAVYVVPTTTGQVTADDVVTKGCKQGWRVASAMFQGESDILKQQGYSYAY